MKSLATSILFFFSIVVSSQTYYPLHPSVGDTIDKLEKLDYSLFPHLSNDNFHLTVIQYTDIGYYLLVIDTNGITTQNEIKKEQLVEAQQNIEKINQYYRLMEEENSKEESTLVHKSKKYPIRLEGPMSEQMRKEARMQMRLKEDKRRRAEFQQGIDINPNHLNIEFR